MKENKKVVQKAKLKSKKDNKTSSKMASEFYQEDSDKFGVNVAIEGTRNCLLLAAKKLFALKGFDGTSVKDLVEAAGHLNISSVSYHFGGKEGLYRACVENYGKSILVMAQRILKTPDSNQEMKIRLRMFIEEMIGNYIDEPELTKILHRDVEMQNTHTEDIFCQTILKIYEVLVEFLTIAQNNKILSSKLDTKCVASLFFGMLTHITRTDLINIKYFGRGVGDPEYRESLIDHIMGLLLDGILSPDQRKDNSFK